MIPVMVVALRERIAAGEFCFGVKDLSAVRSPELLSKEFFEEFNEVMATMDLFKNQALHAVGLIDHPCKHTIFLNACLPVSPPSSSPYRFFLSGDTDRIRDGLNRVLDNLELVALKAERIEKYERQLMLSWSTYSETVLLDPSLTEADDIEEALNLWRA